MTNWDSCACHIQLLPAGRATDKNKVNLGINYSCSEPVASWPKLLRVSSINSKYGGPSRLRYITFNWTTLLELNNCDTGATLWRSAQSCRLQLMVLMSAFGLSAHLHNASCWDIRETENRLLTPRRSERSFVFMHLYSWALTYEPQEKPQLNGRSSLH